MANEGLGWDSLLKMVHNPGGDWHPGWGVDLNGRHIFFWGERKDQNQTMQIYMVILSFCF